MSATLSQNRRSRVVNEPDDQDVDELLSDGDSERGFSVSGRLDAPEAIMIRTGDLHQLIHRGGIDLSPPYQRGK